MRKERNRTPAPEPGDDGVGAHSGNESQNMYGNVNKELEMKAKLWMTMADGAMILAGSSNDFTGTSQYYPTDGSSLDFYALHGNFASGTFTENTTPFPASAIIHSVEAGQSGEDMKAYAKSGLLYAVQKNVARSSSALQLLSCHLLSKVKVALKSGNGSPDLTDAVVRLLGQS